MLEHRALFYADADEFLTASAAFLAEAVERSEAAVVVTTSARCDGLRERLGSAARAVELVDRSAWPTAPEAALDALVDLARDRLHAGAPWIRLLVEPRWTSRSARLWARYESRLNLLLSAAPATVLCAFDTRTTDEKIVSQARVTHRD
jgi:hypothetical protein